MTKSEKKIIANEFGRLLVTYCWDESIDLVERTVGGKMNSPNHKRVGIALAGLPDNQKEAIRELSVLCFNEIVFRFFEMLEQNPKFQLVYKREDVCVDLLDVSDGLFGELFDENGWIDMYSHYKDLTLY